MSELVAFLLFVSGVTIVLAVVYGNVQDDTDNADRELVLEVLSRRKKKQ